MDILNATSIKFSGWKKYWKNWVSRFLAQAVMLNYHEILDGTEIAPKDSATTLSDEQKLNKKSNQMAYFQLLAAVQAQEDIDMIQTSTQDIKTGNARTAFEALRTKYEPSDSKSKMDLIKEYLETKPKENENPTVWLNKMKTLKDKVVKNGMSITDDDFVRRIIENLPNKHYRTFKIDVLNVLDNGNLTETQLNKRLMNYWRMTFNEETNIDDDIEVIYHTQGQKIQCTICGITGHTRFNCNKQKEKESQQPNKYQPNEIYQSPDPCQECGSRRHVTRACWKKLTCTYCHMTGHPTEKCWLKPGAVIPEWAKKKCTFCSKLGHEESSCRAKQMADMYNPREQKEILDSNSEAILYSPVDDQESQINNSYKNLWIGDSGATHHVSNSKEGMFNLHKPETIEKVRTGTGQSAEVELVGDYVGTYETTRGNIKDIVIKNVSYVPQFEISILSLTKAITLGFQMRNIGSTIILSKGNTTIPFDQTIQSVKGSIQAILLKPRSPESLEPILCTPNRNNNDYSAIININDYHDRSGHTYEERMRETAKGYKVKLTGKLAECEACGLAKAERKPLPKSHLSKTPQMFHIRGLFSPEHLVA